MEWTIPRPRRLVRPMPWIILYANDQELQRLELSRPITIGRSAECDIAVRDLLLSRIHCRLEPLGQRGSWRIVDLDSKNGTRAGWQKVESHILREGDWIRMGRTRLTFHLGPFERAAESTARPDRLVRPADPHEALTGTVTDFVLLDDEQEVRNGEDGIAWGGAHPQPRPLDPSSYSEPVVETLLDQLASSLSPNHPSPGDEIAEGLELIHTGEGSSGGLAVAAASTRTATRPARLRALPRVGPVYRDISRACADEADLSLQADPGLLPPLPVAPIQRPTSIAKRILIAGGIGLGMALATAAVLVSAWVLTMTP